MAKIDRRLILHKVKEFIKSPDGKTRINDFILDSAESGRMSTEGGGKILTLDMMNQAADTMIRILRETAAISKLPESVLAHFNSLTHSSPIRMPSGKYRIDIYFKDDLSRMSLISVFGQREGSRTGEGIENIVSLFDTGYRAGDTVFGIWEHHSEPNPIESLQMRESKFFMRKAVDRFNQEYGKQYSAEASITAPDEFYSK